MPVLNVTWLLLLGLLTSTTHWLLARAEISRPFWSRLYGGFDKLARCAGCSGFWLGLGAGALGLQPVTFVLAAPTAADKLAATLLGAFLSGVLAVWLTPVFESALLWGLERSALPPFEEDARGPAPQETLQGLGTDPTRVVPYPVRDQGA